MDAYEALKETFDDLFQQAVEEGCYTEDEAAELVESLDTGADPSGGGTSDLEREHKD